MKLTTSTILSTLLLPVFLIVLDMGTDAGLLVSMWTKILPHFQSTANDTVIVDGFPETNTHFTRRFSTFLFSFLFIVASLYSFFIPNPLPSLLKNTEASLCMQSREQEREDVPVSLGEACCTNLILTKFCVIF